MRNFVEIAIVNGAFVIPGRENGLDGFVQLLVDIGGERLAGLFFGDLLEFGHDLLQVGGGNLRVAGNPGGCFVLVQHVLKVARVGIQHNFTEHLDEAAIGVISETLVARKLDQAQHRLVVDAQVEHSIHHTGHRELRAGTHRDQQRVILLAKALASLLLNDLQRRQGLLPHALWKLLARVIVGVAGLGGDGESGGHRQSGVGHLGHARALASQQIAHFSIAFTK